MKPLQRIGPGLRLAIVAGTSAGIAVSLMLVSGNGSVQVVDRASAEVTTTTAEPSTTTTAAGLDQRVAEVETQVKQVEERVVVVERRVDTIEQATTTTTSRESLGPPPNPTCIITASGWQCDPNWGLPDGQVTSLAVERLWDEPRRQQTGEVDIQVTVAVDAPIHHVLSVLVRVTSVWTAGAQPTETHNDVIVRFPDGITGTATTLYTTIAQVDRVEAAGWRVEQHSADQPQWQPVP